MPNAAPISTAPGGRAPWTAVGFAGLLLAGLGLRVVYTAGALTLGGEYVHDIDPDIYYHLRRLTWADAHGGAPLVHDPFAAAPGGLRCPWPVALEYLALALAAPLRWVMSDPAALRWAAGLLPVLLGLGAVVLAFAALRRAAGAGPALAGAAFVAVSRDALSVSALGVFDHHALELVVCIGMAALASAAARRDRRRAASLGALAFGVGLFVADAAYLVLGAAVLALPLVRREERVGFAAFSAGGFGGIVAATGLEMLLDLPRALPAGGRVALAAAVAGLATAAVARGRRRLAGAAVALVGAAAAMPLLLQAAGNLTATGDPISPAIFQSRPIWAVATPGTLVQALAVTALAAALAPRAGRTPGGALPAALAVIGGLTALVQIKYRFLLAWTGAWALAHGALWLRARAPGLGRIALVTVPALYVAARAAVELRDAPSGVGPRDASFAALAAEIRARTPPQAPLDADEAPTWTLAVRPSHGPRTLHLAGRAVTAVPFWSAPGPRARIRETLSALLTREEADALARLDRLRARYVLVDDPLGYAAGLAVAAGVADAARRDPTYFATTLWSRLFHHDGAAVPGGPPALSAFRLVADTGAFKLFERVPGARLTGRTDPGGRVVLAARIAGTAVAPRPFFAPAEADADGRFALTFPYATEPSAAAHAEGAQLICRTAEVPVTIPESAVTGGRSVTVDCP